jgi:hypothetical protein
LARLQTLNTLKRKYSDDDNDLEIIDFESDANFNDEWHDLIKTYQRKLIPIKSVENNKAWIEYLPNQTHPKESRFLCRIRSSEERILPYLDTRRKTALRRKEGVLRKDYESNREDINSHSKTESHHVLILQHLRKLKEKGLGKKLLTL